MVKLTDSSEFQVAIKMARALMEKSAVAPRFSEIGHRVLEVHPKPSGHFVAGPTREMIAAVADQDAPLVFTEPDPIVPQVLSDKDSRTVIESSRLIPPTPVPISDGESTFRGDRLENALFVMCHRGGFNGALIVDDNGLPLAVHNSPVPEEAIGAFAMVLGAALDKSGKLLGQHDADNVSIDINYTDKIVLRCFHVDETPTYLLVICSQEIDERSEVELSIDQIIQILSRH